MKTIHPNKKTSKFFEKYPKKWYLVNAEGKILGRMASKIAFILQGKHKPIYTPYKDFGDYVIVINAEKIKITAGKEKKKIYWRHSGYPGGLKTETLKEVLEKKPTLIIREAVRRMLPKNKLGKQILRKLKIYSGDNHPHKAQKPEILDI